MFRKDNIGNLLAHDEELFPAGPRPFACDEKSYGKSEHAAIYELELY